MKHECGKQLIERSDDYTNPREARFKIQNHDRARPKTIPNQRLSTSSHYNLNEHDDDLCRSI